ncbi:MAG TPA: fibronectin type III domain-containing protein [Thermoanaerobaculia bacterium]|nr:fibronectin type III domain-containing protein [Thermoanaerobaculia bacterium]
MATCRPRLPVLRMMVAIVAACGVASIAAGDLIRRDSAESTGPRVAAPLLLAEGVLARERVTVDAGLLASVPETLWLELAPGETRLAVLVDSVRTRDGGVVWRGRFLAEDPEYRSVVLSLHDGLVRGSFEGGGVGYSLRPMADGGSELLTLSAQQGVRCGVGVDSGDDAVHRLPSGASVDGPAVAPRTIAAADDAARTLAILVLYVPSLGERWGGRRFAVSYAHHAVDSLNAAFANSRIDGAAFLAGVEEWQHGERDRDRILGEATTSGAVRSLRDAAGADLVAVLTDNSSSSTSRGLCGVANLMSAIWVGPQMERRAFSLTTVDCEANNHPVFVHEIGHNLGANHLPGGSTTPVEQAAFPYAYAHSDDRFRSAMADAGFKPKLVFSNPTVVVDGIRAGVEDERDNARVLQQTIPIAAAFRGGGSAVPRENVPPPVPPPPIVVPGAPTDLQGSVLSATAVRLRWKDNTSDEIAFRIEARNEKLGGGFQTVAQVRRDVVTHDVEGLAPATTYRFRVLALGEQANSSISNEVRLTTRDGPPPPPQGLTATAAGPGAITLSWDAVERASGYEVEVRTADPAADRAARPIVLAPGGTRVEGLEPATPYTLRVRALNALGASEWSAGASATTARAPGPCLAADSALCLLDGRFEVRARWRNPHPPFGHGLAAAQAAPGSGVTGFFTFFDLQNVELVVKMLDGRVVNGSFWHFYGALSDVEYWISVFDTANATSRTYHNQPFSICGQGDTGAFPQAPEIPAAAHSTPRAAAAGAAVPPPATRASAPATGACSPDERALCLAGGRFRVEVSWENPHAPDSRGVGRVFAGAETDLSGHFWFFTPDNLELSVKILDARALHGHFWIFWGGLSDVGYTLHVTDTETGAAHELTNPPLTLCGGAATDLL